MLKALGQASLPLGLLCVGAALDFGTARTWIRPLAVTSAVKFGLMPLATVLACLALGLRGPAAATALLFQALPTASSSYIMARQLGGDAPLMAGIIALQTVLAGRPCRWCCCCSKESPCEASGREGSLSLLPALHRLPRGLHRGEVGAAEFAAIRAQGLGHGAKAALELGGAVTEGRLGVDARMAGEVGDGEQEVADLLRERSLVAER